MRKKIENIKIPRNPFVLFSPFLLLFICMIIIFPTNGMGGDESSYLTYAHYIFYGSLPANETGFEILGKGPGYSIILIPFVALHLPLICITLMNALFYYFSIILLFRALIPIVSFRSAFIVSLFWACYYNLYENMLLILPETFTAFLICLLIFFLMKAFNQENSKRTKKYRYLSGFIIGYIALTKPIFGYVIIFMLAGTGLIWVINRRVSNYRRSLVILLVALATVTPYLIYTYRLTNKIFYWSTLGGNNLYWLSTPYEEEYGNWLHDPKPLSDSVTQNIHTSSFEKYKNAIQKNSFINGYQEYINSNHNKDFQEINKYPGGTQRDDVLMRMAFNNIKSHPIKFIKNCICNVGRIIFNYPYSYKLQNPGTLLRLPLNGTIVVLMLFCIIPTLKNWRKIIFPIRFMLFFSCLYLGGSIFGSAEVRMFTVIVPALLLWIAFIIQKTLKLHMEW